MAGCFGNSAEDRYMERQLDRYLDSQDADEKRERDIDEASDEMMRVGSECYPYKVLAHSYGHDTQVCMHFNFQEAFSELTQDMLTEINCAFELANASQLNSDFAHAGMLLNKTVRAYWKDQAIAVAERTMK